MRKLKRWFRRWRAWRAAIPKIESDYRPVAERLFGGPVTWRYAGGRGRDVVCLIRRDGNPVGFLRLTDPASQPSAPVEAGLPFVSLSGDAKLRREWLAYEQGAPLGLTPRPLWRDTCAMFSAFIDASSLAAEAEREGRSRLELAAEALPAIVRLHAAGIAHMDMSLSNILRERASGRLVFVDFEYGAAPGLAVEQHYLYDYLRLLESVWKFLTPSERCETGAIWGETFKRLVPPTVRAADFSPLRPALGRVLSAQELAPLDEVLGIGH